MDGVSVKIFDFGNNYGKSSKFKLTRRMSGFSHLFFALFLFLTREQTKSSIELSDRLESAQVRLAFSLLPDGARVADSQAVEEVHQDHDYQEEEKEEEAVAEVRVEGNVIEVQFSSEHCECLDQRETDVIEIFFSSISFIFVKQYVERESESNNKERIPSKKRGECLDHFVEHCRVDVDQ